MAPPNWTALFNIFYFFSGLCVVTVLVVFSLFALFFSGTQFIVTLPKNDSRTLNTKCKSSNLISNLSRRAFLLLRFWLVKIIRTNNYPTECELTLKTLGACSLSPSHRARMKKKQSESKDVKMRMNSLHLRYNIIDDTRLHHSKDWFDLLMFY